MLDQETLKEVLDYNPETGIFTWKISAGTVCHGQEAGYLNTQGYRVIQIKGQNYRAHRLAWFYMTGRWPKEGIDHKNGIKDDNWWGNLRECDQTQNLYNSKLRSDNSTGVKGVCWNKMVGKYMARVYISGQEKHLGVFTEIEDAESAVKQAREKYHGEFCNHGEVA